ncbi:MAG: bacteriohemerythrin [Pseudomonadota bacterium]
MKGLNPVASFSAHAESSFEETMKDKDIPGIGVSDEQSAFPNFLQLENEPTATIDLHGLFTRDVTASGSFDIRSGIWTTSFGKLIQALPIPAFLVDRSKRIVAANQACGRIGKDYELAVESEFEELFPDPAAAKKAGLILEKILDTRKPQVSEGILQIGSSRIWGRMSFRSIRIVSERHIVVLIEDLTAEKRQIQLQKKHAMELREEISRRQRAEDALKGAHGQLEERVKERTAELVKSNVDLRREIEDRRRAEQRLTLAKRIIEGGNEAIVVTDSNATIIDVNAAYCRQCGYARHELINRNPRLLKSGSHGSEFYEAMWNMLLTTGEWQGEIWGRRKTGELYPKLLSISAIKDDSGGISHFVGFSTDITKIKRTEEKLLQLAHYDQLTGLANRVLFRERLERAIVQAGRTGRSIALMLLDLDRFKEINDTLGHPAGDRVINAVARRLTECVRESDTVGRLGGDEFTVVLPELQDTYEVNNIANRILRSLEQPFHTNGRKVFISTSMGITVWPADGEDADKLLQNADTALYRAKDQGKNNFQFFSEEMNRDLVEKTELELALRAALEHDELQLFYQPIIDFETGRIVSSEALLRWRHPELGWIPPEKIIRLAEQTGLILSIGEWVLRHACRQAGEWRRMGLPLRVAVNVSGHQLSRPAFVEEVIQIVDDAQLDPSLLELELTESVAMSDIERTDEAFRALRAHGIRVSVDDFGTGYSSLSYLKRLAVDTLKVDRAFVQDIASDSTNKAIVAAIVAMGHSLNLRVLAEGIETREQLGHLWSLDCDEWQGFHFSRPIPARDFTAILRDGVKAPFFSFIWNPDLSVHVEKIDEQHRVWCKRVTEFCKSLWSKTEKDELIEFVDFLADYARIHFGDEESLMLEHSYPGYEDHKIAHQELTTKIEAMRSRVHREPLKTGRLVDFTTELHSWFTNHIQEVDRELGRFLQKVG